MNDAFWIRLLKAYNTELQWDRIWKMISDNNVLGENAIKLVYWLIQKLIYFDNSENDLCLCISADLIKEVFQLAHDELKHSEYAHMHKWLMQGLYIHNISKQLHKFIWYCPQCQLNQTSQHTLYESMQSILSSPQPFHTITLDFILSLSISVELYNTVMSVTDKFSKVVTFVPEKITWEGKKWAVQLLIRLNLLEWELSSVIISDCNVQFVTNLWRVIFEHLHVKLFYSTAYHSQTDRASEVTNQQTEITLWYYLMTMNDIADWLTVLLHLQAAANNAYWTSTHWTLNEVLYEFCLSEALDLLQTTVFTEHDQGSIIINAHLT